MTLITKLIKNIAKDQKLKPPQENEVKDLTV